MISQAEKASGTPECSVNVYLVRESQRGLGKSCVWWKTANPGSAHPPAVQH